MTQVDEQRASTPGFWSRLGRTLAWSITATLKVIFVLAVAALLIAGGYFLTVAAVREYDDVQLRLVKLETDAEFALETNAAQGEELSTLEDETEQLRDDVASVEAALVEDLAAQSERLVRLETDLATALAATETLSQSVTLLSDVAAALQTDINDNVAAIDALGGTSDELTGRLAAVEGDVGDLEGEIAGLESDLAEVGAGEEALVAMGDTLTLFRAWGLVSRARLRLLENNPGLAESDVADAQALLQGLSENGQLIESEAEVLANLQTRLGLIADLLPEDSATAAQDLDTAWNLLDQLLAQRLGEVPVETEVE